MSKLHELAELGQAVWLDFIRRSYLSDGKLKELVDNGLRGVTSNPTIFEKAIAGSSDYDAALGKLLEQNKTVTEIYEALAIEDIVMATDELRPVYDRSGGADGFVSLEVNPTLAYDTRKTIAEAKRLFAAVNRPNLMIKVPATSEGIPAIRELIGSGVNVNVTLIFSIENYKAVAGAYIAGLEKLAQDGPAVKGGHPVDKVASVASFFVSRVDTAVDSKLQEIGESQLQGKIAVANAKVAYQEFLTIFKGPRWQKLADRGARVQRQLWASTSTKNPDYSDVLYVDELIGPHTVNTLPPATLESFVDHGTVAETLTSGVAEARNQLQRLMELGVSYDEITDKLQKDGVVAFAKSYESLISSIDEKRHRMLSKEEEAALRLGKYKTAVDDALKQIDKQDILRRIWEGDHTVWKDDPTEITNRLGWLNSPEVMTENITGITSFVDEVRADGFRQVVLLGMGGSSLAPEVFRHTFAVREGYLDLTVLDSTAPGAVLETEKALDFRKTLFVVSTKSGGTVETLSFFKYFYNKTIEAVGAEAAGKHFIAITDPGSGLEKQAKQLHFRKVFLNDPNIGGRYSALSYFGLVPAALMGVDLDVLLERATVMTAISRQQDPLKKNTPAVLGAVMGELAIAGRDKLTLVTSPQLRHLGAWIEQLVAESTGKEGKGILPVDGEFLGTPQDYANDRLFVYLKLAGDLTHDKRLADLADAGHPVVQFTLKDLYALGGEFFRWEIATVIAGMRIGINPFDQPDVESAKKRAGQMMQTYEEKGSLPELTPAFSTGEFAVYGDLKPETLADSLERFLARAGAGENSSRGRSYVALQAYLPPSPETDNALQELRTLIQRRYQLAATVGYGPRFLHSTGQLHKGDAGHGLFIQITADNPEDAAIPDQPGVDFSAITFGVLLSAQALGDRQALLDKERQVIRIHVKGDIAGALNKLSRIFI